MKGKEETEARARLGSPELRHRRAGTAALPEEMQATGRVRGDGRTRRKARGWTCRSSMLLLRGTGSKGRSLDLKKRTAMESLLDGLREQRER